MSEGVFVYETERAIVRIHPGKLSEEERKIVIENAAKRYLKAIDRDAKKEGKTA